LDQLSGDQLTIQFAIKDKQDNLHKVRKDSILDFASRRERTKSEAIDDFSVTSVNTYVQQLFEKEFQVFSQTNKSSQKLAKSNEQDKEREQLEAALKVLKVINYLCKNSNLFSG
jgi:hypothetical protein